MTRYRLSTLAGSPRGVAHPKPGYGYLGDVYQNSPGGGTIPVGNSQCWDVSNGYGEVNPLYIEHRNFQIGSYSGGNGSYYDDNGWIHWVGNPDAYAISPNVGAPDQNSQMTRGMAGTAPFVPKWDMMAAITQLKDFKSIPTNIRNAGNSILHPGYKGQRKPAAGKPSDFASDFLTWQFGIAPLISDIQSCLRFVDRTEKRIKELRADGRPGGSSRSFTTYRDVSPSTPKGRVYVADHYGAGVQVDLISQTTRRSWTSVTWQIPHGRLPASGSPEEYRLAASLANGTGISPSALWQLMPWTWMADWFTNIGDFIKLSNNIVGAQSGRSCLMEMTKTVLSVRNPPPGYTLSGNGGATFVTKRRTPIPFVYPEVHLPFLTGDMVSILSALAIQRHR